MVKKYIHTPTVRIDNRGKSASEKNAGIDSNGIPPDTAGHPPPPDRRKNGQKSEKSKAQHKSDMKICPHKKQYRQQQEPAGLTEGGKCFRYKNFLRCSIKMIPMRQNFIHKKKQKKRDYLRPHTNNPRHKHCGKQNK